MQSKTICQDQIHVSSCRKAPLTDAQKEIWFLAQRDENASRAYNVPVALRLRGSLNTDAMRHAIDDVVDRHEALRTTINSDGSEQLIRASLAFDLPLVDLSGLEVTERDNRLTSLMAEISNGPLDLSQGPLFRASIIRVEQAHHVLILVVHHIVTDGWSMSVLVKDIADAYKERLRGAVLKKKPPLQLREYTSWLNKQLQDPSMQDHESFWMEHLAGPLQQVDLPTDRPRPPIPTFSGARQSVKMESALVKLLYKLTQERRCTPFMTLLAGYMSLLHRLSGQDDLIVVVPVANRALKGGGELIGYCVNIIPVRSHLSAEMTFNQYLAKLRATLLDAYSHSACPFVSLFNNLKIPHDRSRPLLFGAFFNMNAPLTGAIKIQDLDIDLLPSPIDYTLHELSLDVVPLGDELILEIGYNTDLFSADTASRIAQRLMRLFEQVTADPTQCVAQLDLLTTEERRNVVLDWNATKTDYPRDLCLHQLFEAQVEKTADATAVVFEDQSLTYAELDARSNQLAQYLRTLGVGPDVPVAIFTERSLEMVVGLYGILKAGGAYLPLDPDYPKERLGYILEGAQAPVVLTQRHLQARMPSNDAEVVALDEAWATIAQAPASTPTNLVMPQNLAYVIYTSGSTGRPKGVAVPHAGIVNRLLWMQEAYGLDATDRVLQKTPFSFDVSVWEFFWPLMTGAQLVVAKPGGHRDSAYLAALIAQEQITTLHFVPPMLAVFLDEPDIAACRSLRRVICSGEALPPELMQRHYERLAVPLHNLYGPTEASVDVSYWACKPDTILSTVPIGRPIANTQLYILDPEFNPVPAGVAGELHIGGVGLARGYLRRPELTAEKFIPDPFSDTPSARLYQTGDLARFLPDGNIEFLARIDHQVKIRGFRIELGEIEATLTQHPAVREAVVLAREDSPGDRRLAAYVVAAPEAELDVSALRADLKDKLPEYMVPAAFVVLEALPLTPNGKVDRKALPVPDSAVLPTQAYVAPRTPTEQMLADIWAEVLGVERVGIRDNFFDLGGHSLLVTQVVSRIRETFEIEIPLRVMFEADTIVGLAKAVENIQKSGEGLQAPPIEPVSRDSRLLLSFAQERLWFLDQLEPDSAFYNIGGAIRLHGALEVAALELSLNAIIERHEALRTTFPTENGQGLQVISPVLPLDLPFIDLTDLAMPEREAKARELITDGAKTPFDLAAGPLVRARLFQIADDDHVLQVTFHHIVADGWSVAVFINELAALYRAFTADEPLPLAPLPIQYADFAHWQRHWLQAEVLEQQLSYWKAQLDGVPGLLELPTDRPRPTVQSYNGAHHPITITPELTEALRVMSREVGVTLFMTLLAAFQVLLARYTGQRDFAVGTPIANRNRTETEGLIGFFVNSLVLRADLADNPSFQALLARTRETTLGAYAHQDLPFERLVDELHPERDMSHSPLFQVMFALQNAPLRALELPGLQLTPWTLESGTAKFDLSLELVEEGDELTGTLEYNTDLFDAASIVRLADHFTTLLKGITQTSQAKIAELPMLTEAERHQVLVDWNATETDFPHDLCVQQLFEAQVDATPVATAVVFGDKSLTYAELNARANQLANHLCALGVGPDVLVGLCVERSLEMIVGLLGILKAGGGYVPMDPAYPKERLAFMLEDIQAPVLVTQTALLKALPANDTQVVCLDSDWKAIDHLSKSNPVNYLQSENLAYVIYTSGSTGRPKGSGVSHRGLVNLLDWFATEFELNADDKVLLISSLSFDLTQKNLLAPLLVGGQLHMLASDLYEPTVIAHTVEHNCITLLNCTPSAFYPLVENVSDEAAHDLKSLRYLFLGGEPISLQSLQQWIDTPEFRTTIVNTYGPTECTDVVASYRLMDIEKSLDSPVPIGMPINNVSLLVLDSELNPCPVGIVGEVFIGGVSLGRGYLNRPDLTAEKFIPNPFSEVASARLYKTGDRARYMPDGNIEFLGRIDHQVKIRGFRIELSEIETILAQHPAVYKTVVVARQEDSGNKQVVAYVVVTLDVQLQVNDLRTFLKEKLPDYMVPAAFVILEEFPLSPNGKVDRKALPAPDSAVVPTQAYVAPRTPTEQMLADIWAEVLGVERVGIHDNFFDLGGHSLLVTQVVSRMRAAFETELPLRMLFETPTVDALARAVEAARQTGVGLQAPPITPVARDGALPLSSAQQRLWFLDQLKPQDPFYNMPGAVRLQGALDEAALVLSLNALIARHEALRTNFLTVDGEAVQVIAPSLEVALPVIDLTKLSDDVREAQAHELAHEEAHQPFNLTKGSLIRARLLRLADHDHLLQVTFHHIVADGWSLGIFVQELAALYRAFTTEQPSPLTPLPIQYVDFAHWQRQWLQGEVLEQQLAYWRERLKDLPPLLELPTDRPRPAMQTFLGAHHPITIAPELTEALRALTREAGVTLFMTLLAAFQVLLARYTGQRNFAVGTPIANRNRAETEGLIGFFINTLVLRADLADNPRFQDVLARTKETTLGAYAHQDLPFERLVNELQPERDISHSPLFQVMFALQNAPLQPANLPGLQLTPWVLEFSTAKFDLTLELSEEGDELNGTLEYNTDLFDQATISRLAGHFAMLLEGIAKAPQVRVSEPPLLTSKERQQLLVDWNGTDIDFPEDQCIHQLFEAQVEQAPEATAVLFQDQKLTYTKLNVRANQLAHFLRSLGVGPDTLVGLCIEQSLEMVIGLLGILKAGGAYVPLDPAYPQERLAFMLKDSRAPVLMTQAALTDLLPVHSATVVCQDRDWSTISAYSQDNPINQTQPTNLAYVIYTSGSTGRPKGVQLHHQGLTNLVSAQAQAFGVRPSDRVLQFASFSFDASVWETFMALTAGAGLCLGKSDDLLPGTNLSRLFTEQAISVATLPPTAAKVLPDDACDTLRTLIVAGEACSKELVERFSAGRCFFNAYGPTESTVCATLIHCQESETDPPIGRPIANTSVYILGPDLNPVPIGVSGELHIGGVQLARGYLNRPDLTAERFIPNPFDVTSGTRLYKTGDLVRYLPDGNIEFLGRIDHQVKVRGFRIELGEIEAVLAQHSAVNEVVVLGREDSPGDKRVVAYLVAASEAELDVSELRAHVKEKLPEYMVPSAFVNLDTLPLTPNGKVDRKALPAPDARPAVAEAYEAPRSPIEQKLSDIWAELLRVEHVGIHDNFFELGGDSIIGIQTITRASEAGIELTARQLFEHQTVAGLAAVAGTAKKIKAEQGPVTGPIPLTPIQHWFFERQLPSLRHFNQSVLLEAQEALDPKALMLAIGHLLEHHDAMRMRFEEAATGWRQTNAEHEIHEVFTNVDLASQPASERLVVLETTAAQLQASLDIDRGPLLRAVLFKLGPDQSDRLLLVIHHLVVDGVSWRIILEDLYSAYKQLQSGQPVALPSKTTSFKEWAEQLQVHTKSDLAHDELEYWLTLAEKPVSSLPIDTPGGTNTVGASRTVTVALSPEETQVLLQEAPEAYHTQVNDLLLTALVQTVTDWSGSTAVWVDLEGHGREPVSDDLDVSRTVGWFTALFPMRLDLTGITEIGAAIKGVKEQLRHVPRKGFGYGLLRYLADREVRDTLKTMPTPEVCFNYLGQFDQVLPDAPLRLAHDKKGAEHHEDEPNHYLLDISGMVMDGQLIVRWTYSEQLYRYATIDKVAQEFAEALRVISNHCLSAEAGGFTPSDFTDVDLSQDDLEGLLAEYESANN